MYRDSQLGWWHIGLGVFNVGSAYIHNRDVLSVAGPFMHRLMLLSGETVNVAIRSGNEAVLKSVKRSAQIDGQNVRARQESSAVT